jgi:hypothetical protein
MRERDWQRTVVDLAEMYRWRVYHTFDSRRSEPGWPDLFCVKPGRAVALELKTQRGRVTAEQYGWLGLLASVPGVDAMLARPSDLERVAQLFGPRKEAA